MPYLVNKTHDDLRVPELGRVVAAGDRLDATVEQAARFAGHPCFDAFEDDGTPIPAAVPDWGPKKIVLSPEFTAQPDAATGPPETLQESAAGAGQLGRPFYLFAGAEESEIDQKAWPLASEVTAELEPRPLYHFAGDQPGGPPTGASAGWVVYTGPTQEAGK